ncbi:MAG: Gfo/Idh/MocA family protein [Candidatus Xenobia bacterium]
MKIGIVGCGAFGRYALEQMTALPGVRVVAAADANASAAEEVAAKFGARVLQVDDLLADSEVELAYLATPPWLHPKQALAGLRNGKHVLCEKPLAVKLSDADAMLAEAQARQRLCVVHLLQRYNPLAKAVQRMVEERLLGEPLHGYFENYAADENLSPQHWFWDREKSGGIFIEHGVHFFDLFRMWLGEGKVRSGGRVRRASGLEDQVYCTARYGEVPVHFYHGFTQPLRMDRQELRLLFERGDLTLHEWVPTRITVRALVDDAALARLRELLPDATLQESPGEAEVGGRHKQFHITRRVELQAGAGVLKAERYADCIRAFVRDQLQWIENPQHARRVTEDNGRASLQMAADATRFADEQEPVAQGVA